MKRAKAEKVPEINYKGFQRYHPQTRDKTRKYYPILPDAPP